MKKMILLLSLLSFQAFGMGIPEELKDKTINLISPSTAGGQNDIMARAVAKKVEEQTGLKIVVINKPGASGNIGAKFVQESAPNGLTLCHCDAQQLVFNQLLGPELSIKFGDLEAISIIRESPFAVVVPYNSNITSISKLLDEIKKRELKFSTFGSLSTVWGLQLSSLSNSNNKMNIIPYKGDPENIIAVAQEAVDFTIVGLSSALRFEEANKTKIIAITSNKRLPQLDKYPTIKETHDMTAYSFSGIFAPKNVPDHIKVYLNTVFANAIKDKEMVEFLRQRGAVPLGGDLKNSAAYFSQQHKSTSDFIDKNRKMLAQ